MWAGLRFQLRPSFPWCSLDSRALPSGVWIFIWLLPRAQILCCHQLAWENSQPRSTLVSTNSRSVFCPASLVHDIFIFSLFISNTPVSSQHLLHEASPLVEQPAAMKGPLRGWGRMDLVFSPRWLARQSGRIYGLSHRLPRGCWVPICHTSSIAHQAQACKLISENVRGLSLLIKCKICLTALEDLRLSRVKAGKKPCQHGASRKL